MVRPPWQPPQPVLEHNLHNFGTDTLHQHTFTPIISNSSEQLDIEREASKTTTAYIPDHALVQATTSRGASPQKPFSFRFSAKQDISEIPLRLRRFNVSPRARPVLSTTQHPNLSSSAKGSDEHGFNLHISGITLPPGSTQVDTSDVGCLGNNSNARNTTPKYVLIRALRRWPGSKALPGTFGCRCLRRSLGCRSRAWHGRGHVESCLS